MSSCGEIPGIDCSPAELEELIKEVRLSPTLNHLLNCVAYLSPPLLSLCVTFVSLPHCSACSSTLSLDVHDCEVYKGALLAASYDVFFLQEDGCIIQASPEYWSQGSISGKTTFFTQFGMSL